MSDAPSWLFDYFWCDTCNTSVPKLSYYEGRVVNSIWILGTEFDAYKCVQCGTVKVNKKYKEPAC